MFVLLHCTTDRYEESHNKCSPTMFSKYPSFSVCLLFIYIQCHLACVAVIFLLLIIWYKMTLYKSWSSWLASCSVSEHGELAQNRSFLSVHRKFLILSSTLPWVFWNVLFWPQEECLVFSSLQKFPAHIGKHRIITVKGDAEDETQFCIYWGDKTVQPW